MTGELGSNRVSTCWETADRLAVRYYCHVKRTVKKMNEMRPAELAGSQLGSPGDEESMEEKRTCCVSFGACLCFPSLWKKGIYLLSSVPRVGSLLQPGHSVTHTCTRAHKHADVCTLFLPRYIIISSSLYRLSGALDLRGERRRADGRLITSGGQFTRLH